MTHLLQNNGNDKTMIKQWQRHINYKTMATTKTITMIEQRQCHNSYKTMAMTKTITKVK